MGWNSYDCYGGSINEQQYKECVNILSEKLLPFGYEYAVIDIAWYNPQVKRGEGVRMVTIDECGRTIPAPNRFPSSQ